MTDILEALSPLGALGFTEESISAGYGVAQTVDTWCPITSDSLKYDQPQKEQETIFNNVDIQDSADGLVTAGGNIVLPVFGQTAFGWLLKWLTRSHASNAFPYAITAAPTLNATGSGSNTGAFFYAVATVVKETASGLLFLTQCSPTSLVVNPSSQNVAVTWANPSSTNLPIGFTAAGTVIFKTAASGASGTETAYDYVTSPTATTYTDTGTAIGTGGTTGQGRVNVVYQHLFSPASTQPRSFTVEKVMNNGKSEQYPGCMVNSMALPIKPADVLSATFDIFAQTMNPIDSTTPTISQSPAFSGFRSNLLLGTQGGTLAYDARVTETALTVNNGLDRRWNLNGLPTVRKIKATLRKITGDVSVEFEGIDQLQHFQANDAMALYTVSRGGGTTPGWKFGITVSSVAYTIYSWPFMVTTDVPNAKYNSHQANLNTKNVIIQKLPWIARGDATKGYALQLGLYNTANTTAYNDKS